jgi:hypothetical protein
MAVARFVLCVFIYCSIVDIVLVFFCVSVVAVKTSCSHIFTLFELKPSCRPFSSHYFQLENIFLSLFLLVRIILPSSSSSSSLGYLVSGVWVCVCVKRKAPLPRHSMFTICIWARTKPLKDDLSKMFCLDKRWQEQEAKCEEKKVSQFCRKWQRKKLFFL